MHCVCPHQSSSARPRLPSLPPPSDRSYIDRVAGVQPEQDHARAIGLGVGLGAGAEPRRAASVRPAPASLRVMPAARTPSLMPGSVSAHTTSMLRAPPLATGIGGLLAAAAAGLSVWLARAARGDASPLLPGSARGGRGSGAIGSGSTGATPQLMPRCGPGHRAGGLLRRRGVYVLPAAACSLAAALCFRLAAKGTSANVLAPPPPQTQRPQAQQRLEAHGAPHGAGRRGGRRRRRRGPRAAG
jgi:hypothetical protein